MLTIAVMASPSEKIFTRDFVILFAINFIIVMVQFLFLTTMALYAMQHFNANGTVGGITASIFMFGAVVGRVLSAHYITTLTLRKYCVISLVGQLIACVAYLFSDIGISFLIAVRIFHGLSFGVANTVAPALAVDSLPKSRIGEGSGYFLLSTSIGVGIGPLMTIVTAMGVDYVFLFFIAITFAVISLVLSFFIRPTQVEIEAREKVEREKAQHEYAKPAKQKWTLGSILDLSTVKVSFFMLLIAFASSSLSSFLSGYAASLDMAIVAPIFFLVYSVALIVSRPIAGKLMDRHGENIVLYPSIICMGIACALAASAINPVILVSASIFMALGFGVCMSVGQAVAVTTTKSTSTALTISTFFLLNDLGIGLGPFFLGFIVEGAGYRIMYWQCVVVALIALVYYHFTHGKHHMKRRERKLENANESAH